MKTKTTLSFRQMLIAALVVTNALFTTRVIAQMPNVLNDNPNLQNSGIVYDAAETTPNTNFLTNISIYPRPTHNFVNIRAQVTSQVTINLTVIDMLGRVIMQRTEALPVGLYEHQIDLSNLPNGMYLLQIKSGDQSITTKLIKS